MIYISYLISPGCIPCSIYRGIHRIGIMALITSTVVLVVLEIILGAVVVVSQINSLDFGEAILLASGRSLILSIFLITALWLWNASDFFFVGLAF